MTAIITINIFTSFLVITFEDNDEDDIAEVLNLTNHENTCSAKEETEKMKNRYEDILLDTPGDHKFN